VNVVVCDDHRVFTDALVSYLEDMPDIESVEAVHEVDDALRRVRQGADLLLLDLSLDKEDEDGLTVVEAVGHLGLSIRILILSGCEDVPTIAHGLRLGAHGFCGKNARPEQLVSAIRQVMNGDVTLPSHLTQPVLAELRGRQVQANAQADELARLTPREQEVLRLLANGKGSSYIARALGLSQNTVRTHLQHIMGKLGVHTQLHAAAEGRRLLGGTSPAR
jgi:two-component system nitrate/nitrite response regulator NarL